MPGLAEEVKKKVNRPVADLPLSDDTDVIVSPGAELQRPRQRQRQWRRRQRHIPEPVPARTIDPLSQSVAHFQQDAPTCPKCGHVAVRNGACFKCLNCGESLGCS